MLSKAYKTIQNSLKKKKKNIEQQALWLVCECIFVYNNHVYLVKLTIIGTTIKIKFFKPQHKLANYPKTVFIHHYHFFVMGVLFSDMVIELEK